MAESDPAAKFAWIRTRLAVERTMMAAVRTATALIAFGFTIVQFFEHFADSAGPSLAGFPNAHLYMGLVLIAAGIAVLGIAAWQYHAVVRELWVDYPGIRGFGREPHRTPTFAVAVAMILAGMFAFLSVFFTLY